MEGTDIYYFFPYDSAAPAVCYVEAFDLITVMCSEKCARESNGKEK